MNPTERETVQRAEHGAYETLRAAERDLQNAVENDKRLGNGCSANTKLRRNRVRKAKAAWVAVDNLRELLQVERRSFN